MNKHNILETLIPVIPENHLRLKLVNHGYISLTSLERNSISTRPEIETALSDAGLGPQAIGKLIAFGCH